jgi:hypothetical protein
MRRVSADASRGGVETGHDDDAARGDMRIEVVKRELNQGALGGSGTAVTDYAARLIIAALNSFDQQPAARLARIAEAHHKHIDGHGGTDGMCHECGWHWPCPTWTWATEDRDPLACWNPRDDEETADV